MTAILVENLVKQYRNGVKALNGLSLTVKEGEIFSLLGENGAGKSTLVHILTTYLRPTSGSVHMLGKDLFQDASAIRSKIACVAQKNSIDTYLSAEENMMFQSRLYKIPQAKAKERMKTLLACFDLERYMQYPVSSYSGGVKRRLDVALSLMSAPGILFLDEPTVGMDLPSRRAMWETVKKIREDFGTTVFLTTHYLEEADLLSDDICIVKTGKEIAQGTPGDLRKYLRQDMLKIRFADRESAKQAITWLREIFIGRSVEEREATLTIPAENSRADLALAGRVLLDRQVALTGLEIAQPTIEDVFLRLTGNEEGCA